MDDLNLAKEPLCRMNLIDGEGADRKDIDATICSAMVGQKWKIQNDDYRSFLGFEIAERRIGRDDGRRPLIRRFEILNSPDVDVDDPLQLVRRDVH